MAYCRFDEDSDIYLVDCGDRFECFACSLKKIEETIYYHRTEVIKHLEVHRNFGHKVPEYVFERLIYELRNLGDEIDQESKRLPPKQVFSYWITKKIIDLESANDFLKDLYKDADNG